MTVIRDEQFFGMMMIPFFNQYQIHRCNVSECHEKPTTVITDCVDNDGDKLNFALCEKHYQESKEKGRIDYRLDFFELSKPETTTL